MTQNQFSNYTYRHSEIIVYHQKHPCVDIECMLIGIDFDNGLFNLYPIDQELYEDKSYWLPFKSCDKKARKPKMAIVRCSNVIKSKQ
jgi:hypothetical protein